MIFSTKLKEQNNWYESMKRIIFIILFILGSYFNNYAFIYSWEVITNMNDIRDMAIITFQGEEKIFAATNGGLLIKSLQTNEHSFWNSGQGLLSHNFTRMTLSSHNQVILGTQEGHLVYFDLLSQEIQQESSLAGNPIYGLYAVEDTLWVASNKMIAVYQFNPEKNRYEFRDFFTNFNHDFSSFSDIVYFHHRVWVSSDNGLFSAPGNYLKFNLKAAESWDVYTKNDGLPHNKLHTFALRNDTLFIGSHNGLVVYDGSLFQVYKSGLNDRRVLHISTTSNQLYVATPYYVFKLNPDKTFQTLFHITNSSINDLVVDSQEEILVALKEKGIRNLSNGDWFRVNGPIDNSLGEMIFDRNGNLWVVTGGYKDERARGFSFRDNNGIWHNFRYLGRSWRMGASTTSILEDKSGNIWIGSWGGGLIVIDPRMHFYHFNNNRKSGALWISSAQQDDTVEVEPPDSLKNFISPVVNEDTVVVVTDLILDRSRDKIWLLNLNPQSRKPIIQYQYSDFNENAFQKNSWQGVDIPVGIAIESNAVASITMDIFRNLWIGTGRSGVLGILFQSDGTSEWVSYTETQNLKSNQCWAVAADRDGYVWFGTNSGLNAYLNGKLYDFREDFQPIGLRIHAIFVDSENNKWFATDKGLSLLKASGSPWNPESWIHLVPKNSEFYGDRIYHTNLPAEEIRSVYVDSTTGDVYCGTSSGLAIMRSNPFTTPRTNLSFVKAGPQPFVLSGNSQNYFYFHNLTGNVQIKIVTPAGRLVRILDAMDSEEILGSLGKWDGRNESGNLVSSGVYLYLISDENGNSTTGKILVIHK